MNMVIHETIFLEEIRCGTCGIMHAVPQDWIKNKRSEKGDIHCPNGCVRTWTESDADRLRKQLENRERELRESKCEVLRKQQALDSERLAREKIENKLRRSNKGVCTCCNRSFENLQRHMKTKHPEVK
jgi:hypothetical protein